MSPFRPRRPSRRRPCSSSRASVFRPCPRVPAAGARRGRAMPHFGDALAAPATSRGRARSSAPLRRLHSLRALAAPPKPPATRASRSPVRSPLRPPPAASSPRYPSSLRPAATSAASLGRRLGRRRPAASGHGLCLRSGARSARSGHPAPVARYAPGPMTYGPAPERFYIKKEN